MNFLNPISYILGLSFLFLLTACSEEETKGNPGFVRLETMNGTTEESYYTNFEEDKRPIDIYKDPSKVEDERVVKIESEEDEFKGSVVVNESASGVGFIYDDGAKKEVIVTSDADGQLWAVDEDGNSYPVNVDMESMKKRN